MHSDVMKSILNCIQDPKPLTEICGMLNRTSQAVHKNLRELEDMGVVYRARKPNPRAGRRGQTKEIVVWAISSSATIDSIAADEKK